MREADGNIFASAHLRIDFFRTKAPSGKLIFCFTEYTNRELEGPGFGGEFALGLGFDVVAVKSNLDDWFHSLTAEILADIGRFLHALPERPAWRATYGSSMGGYAALMFARALQADVAFALSPQFDITRDWDRRWAKPAEALRGMRVLDADAVRPQCRYVIAYDPMDADRLHFERFAAVIPAGRLLPVTLPYAGHPVGYLLRDTGTLKSLAAAVLNGLGPPSLRDRIRRRRRSSTIYLNNLAAHCRRRGKPRWAWALHLKAVDLQPLNAELQIEAARLAAEQGEATTALRYAALAAALSPAHPHIVAFLALSLLHKGLYPQALHFIDVALALEPEAPGFLQLRATIQSHLK